MQFILGFLEGGVHTNEVDVWKTHKNYISNMMHALRAALQETKICNSMRRFGRSCS